VTYGAIGIAGYLSPSTVHVVDRHGLADPLAARLRLERRGRPGHEKRLPNAWIVARFAQPQSPEDASVVAARRALACGALRSLEHAIRDPLSLGLFVDNIVAAPTLHRLRIPSDPFEAESLFCKVQMPFDLQAGGDGGSRFHWHCPEGTVLSGARGSTNDEEKSIAHFQPICRIAHETNNLETTNEDVHGPAIGEVNPNRPFEVQCLPGERVVGWFGSVTRFVHSIGFVCSSSSSDDISVRPATSHRTAAAGHQTGHPIDLRCPDGAVAIGIAGRAGSLIDAIGIVCPPSRRPTEGQATLQSPR
jgi:hypothetical protein